MSAVACEARTLRLHRRRGACCADDSTTVVIFMSYQKRLLLEFGHTGTDTVRRPIGAVEERVADTV